MLINLLLVLGLSFCMQRILFEGASAGGGAPRFDRWAFGFCLALSLIVVGLGERM